MKGADWGKLVLGGASDAVRALNPGAFAELEPKRRALKRARPIDTPIEAANLPWAFTLDGAPRTKNTGKSPRPGVVIPSPAYRDWFHAAMAQVLRIRAAGVVGVCNVPVVVTATWWRDADRGDEDRYKVALGDFLQRAGFVFNDDLIHWGGGCRREIDRANPRIDVRVELDQPMTAKRFREMSPEDRARHADELLAEAARRNR